MASHRIGDLELRLLLPDPEPALATRAQRFVEAIWEAVGDTLERRYPGRVFHVRAFEGRWVLERDELTCGRPPADLVARLVAACEAVPPQAIATPVAEHADVVVFADERADLAAWLVARAARTGAAWPWSARQAAGGVAHELRMLVPATVVGMLDLLDHHRLLEPVLRGLERSERPQVLRAAAAALAWDGVATNGLPGAAPVATASPGPEYGLRTAPAATLHGVMTRLRARPRIPERPPLDESSLPAGPATVTLPPATSPGTGDLAARGAPDAPDPAPTGPDGAPGGADGHGVASMWGGLALLVRPLLQLRVMEALWELCLPENAVLHAALAAVCGDDPVGVRLSHGDRGCTTGSRHEDVEVGTEQLEEFGTRLESALHAVVGSNRAGAALDWARTWAWDGAPGGTSDPPGAPDTGGVGALGPLVLGVPAALLALRIDPDLVLDRDALVARFLRVPVRLIDDGETLGFRFAGELVDLRLRRAGVDADPGWVPWLARTVRLHYTVDELREP